MKKITFFLSICCLLGGFPATAQRVLPEKETIPPFQCGVQNEPKSKELVQQVPNSRFSYFMNFRNWIPLRASEPLSYSPELHIPIAIHVILNSDGMGSRYIMNEETRQKLHWYIDEVNELYKRNNNPSDYVEGVIEIPNRESQIFFELKDSIGRDRIFFYESSQLTQSKNIEKEMLELYPHLSKFLNIFYTPNVYRGGAGVTGIGSFPGPNATSNFNSSVVMFRANDVATIHTDGIQITTIAHELAHCMEVEHTFETNCSTGSLEYISDIFGPSESSTCPHKKAWQDPYDNSYSGSEKITNNVMGGTPSQVYFSPMQIGIMHRAFSLRSVGRYAWPLKSPIPYKVENKEIWDLNIRMFRDIIVYDQLELYTGVTMHADASTIFVEMGGVLTIKTNTFVNGPIRVRNGGTLRIEDTLRIKGPHSIKIDKGGDLCVAPGGAIILEETCSALCLDPKANIGSGAFSDCKKSISDIALSGKGSVQTFVNDIVLISKVITTDRYYAGRNITIKAGSQKAPISPRFDYDIDIEPKLLTPEIRNCNVVLEASNEVLINNILVDKGASLYIKKYQ